MPTERIQLQEEILVTLGVYDDGDKVPTVVFGVIYPNTEQDISALLTEMVGALIEAARVEYGSRFPTSSCFWSAQTRVVEPSVLEP